MGAIRNHFQNRSLKQRALTSTGVGFNELEHYLNKAPTASNKPLVVKKRLNGQARISRHKAGKPSVLTQLFGRKQAKQLAQRQQLFFDQTLAGANWLRQFDDSPGVLFAIQQIQTRSPGELADTDDMRRYVGVLAAAERRLDDRLNLIEASCADMRELRRDLLERGDSIKVEYPEWSSHQHLAASLNKQQLASEAKGGSGLSGMVQAASREQGVSPLQYLEKLLSESAVPYGLLPATFDALLGQYEALRMANLWAVPEQKVFASATSAPTPRPASPPHKKQVRFALQHTEHVVERLPREAVVQQKPVRATVRKEPEGRKPSLALKVDLVRAQRGEPYARMAETMAQNVVREYRKHPDKTQSPLKVLGALAREYSDIQLTPQDPLFWSAERSELENLQRVLGLTPVLRDLEPEEQSALLDALDEAFAAQA